MKKKPISNPESSSILTWCGNVFGIILVIVFGLGFLAMGCIAFWAILLNPLIRMNASESWDEINCKVLTSSISIVPDGDGKSSYEPNIHYEYEVGGNKYKSSAFGFGNIDGSKEWAIKVAEHFAVGKERTCYFDPDNPADSVLYRGYSRNVWSGLIGLFFVFVGAGFLFLPIWYSLDKRKKLVGQNAAPASADTQAMQVAGPGVIEKATY